METYRASEMYNSAINRSYASQGNVKSNIESVIEYQNSQTLLFKVTLYLSIILVAACLLLIGHMLFSRGYKRLDGELDKSAWSSMDRVKYTLFNQLPHQKNGINEDIEKAQAMKTEPGFLEGFKDIWPSSKGCAHIKELEQKLSKQRFSVQKYIDNLPDYNEIKNNREKFELSNELNQSCLEGDIETTRSMFDKLSARMDQMIGGSHLDLKSTQEDFTAVNAQLHDNGRYKDAERLLDNDFIYSVKGDVSNLVNSHKNLQEKKILLNGYRFNLFNQVRKLESVIKDIKSLKADFDSEKTREVELQNKLKEAEQVVHKVDKLMEDKEATMSNEQQKGLAELRDVSDKIEEIKMSIANVDKIREEIRQRNDRISKNQNMLDETDSKIADLEKHVDSLNAERKVKSTNFKNLHDMNEIYNSRKNIHNIKLEVLLRNKDIKSFLDKLINGQTNIESLSELMNSKISDEEKLMVLMNQYNEESEKMDETEGKTIVDRDSVTSEELKSRIEKDRENFKQIMEKYLGLKKVVDEYEDPDLEIRNLKVKINEIEEKKQSNLDKQNKLKEEMNQLDKNIKNNTENIQDLKEKRKKIQDSIDQDKKFIKEKEDMLEDAERKLKEFQNKKSSIDVKYKVG